MSVEQDKGKTVKAKAGTSPAKVEVIIGAGAKALNKAIITVEKLTKDLKAVADESDKLTEVVSAKQTELEQLDVQLQEKARQGVLDVELKVKESKRTAVNSFLTELKMEAVNSEDYAHLQTTLSELQGDFEAAVAKQVGIQTSHIKTSYEQQKKIDEANAKGAQAQQAAELEAAKAQVVFFKQQVESLTKQIDSERNARVEEARARGNASVNITNTK